MRILRVEGESGHLDSKCSRCGMTNQPVCPGMRGFQNHLLQTRMSLSPYRPSFLPYIDISHGHECQSTDRTVVAVTFMAQGIEHSHSFNSSPVTPIWGCFLTEQVGTTQFSPNSPYSEERDLGGQIPGRTVVRGTVKNVGCLI